MTQRILITAFSSISAWLEIKHTLIEMSSKRNIIALYAQQFAVKLESFWLLRATLLVDSVYDLMKNEFSLIECVVLQQNSPKAKMIVHQVDKRDTEMCSDFCSYKGLSTCSHVLALQLMR